MKESTKTTPLMDYAESKPTPRWALINGEKRWIVGRDSAGRTIYESGSDAEYKDFRLIPLYHFDRLEELPMNPNPQRTADAKLHEISNYIIASRQQAIDEWDKSKVHGPNSVSWNRAQASLGVWNLMFDLLMEMGV